jgi:hypothetical protein
MTDRYRLRARRFANPGGSPRWKPRRCPTCGSPDVRDAAHARGCPALPAVSSSEMLRLALAVEAGRAKAEEAR